MRSSTRRSRSTRTPTQVAKSGPCTRPAPPAPTHIPCQRAWETRCAGRQRLHGRVCLWDHYHSTTLEGDEATKDTHIRCALAPKPNSGGPRHPMTQDRTRHALQYSLGQSRAWMALWAKQRHPSSPLPPASSFQTGLACTPKRPVIPPCIPCAKPSV